MKNAKSTRFTGGLAKGKRPNGVGKKAASQDYRHESISPHAVREEIVKGETNRLSAT